VFANVDAATEPMLAEALAINTRTAEELFADSIRAFLRGAVADVLVNAPAPRALIGRSGESRPRDLRWPDALTSAIPGS
jgi:hypothetical protein